MRVIIDDNKKVLLRERKRHTTRRVAIAIFLLLREGGPLNKKFFFPVWTCIKPNLLSKIFPFTKTGYPPPPKNLRPGTPPENLRPGTPPQKIWDQVPPPPKIWDQVPPPEMLTDRHLWKQYLPVILRMRAVNITCEQVVSRHLIVHFLSSLLPLSVKAHKPFLDMCTMCTLGHVLFVRCRVAAQVSGSAEIGGCFDQLNLYWPMISRWILRLFQYKQELSSVYQFIDVL